MLSRGGFLRRLGLLPAAGVAAVLGRDPVAMGDDGRVEVDAAGNVALINCVVAGGLVAQAAGSIVVDRCSMRSNHDQPALSVDHGDGALITGCIIENHAWKGHWPAPGWRGA